MYFNNKVVVVLVGRAPEVQVLPSNHVVAGHVVRMRRVACYFSGYHVVYSVLVVTWTRSPKRRIERGPS